MVLKKWLFQLIGFMALVVTGLVIISAFAGFDSGKTNKVLFYLMVLCTGLFTLGFIYVCIVKFNIEREKFIISLIVFIYVIRCLWVLHVPTQPVSDFQAYQSYTYNILRGFYTAYHPTYTVFPFKIGYPIILAFVYKIAGISLLAAEMFNVIMSIVAGLLIYFIGARAFNEKAGRISAILFAVWPAQIMFTSVLAAEHVFLVTFLLSILLLLKLPHYDKTKNRYAIALLIGVDLTVTQFVRPISLIMFPIILLYIVFYCDIGYHIRQRIINKTVIPAIIFLSYTLSLLMLNHIVYRYTEVNITKSSPGYNLLIGTNYEHKGMANDEDQKIVTDYDYDYNKIHDEALKTALGRISASPAKFLGLAADKFVIQWSDENYGVFWAASDFHTENQVTGYINAHRGIFFNASQIFYMLIMLFVFMGCTFAIRKKMYPAIIFFTIFVGLAASYTFLEVQSRYHYPAVPFLILMAGFGMSEIIRNLPIPNKGSIPKDTDSDTKIENNSCWKMGIITLVVITTISFILVKAGNKQTGVPETRINYNGNVVHPDIEPVRYKNSTFVSIDTIKKIPGVSVIYDNNTGVVAINQDNSNIVLKINSKDAAVNGYQKELVSPVKHVNDIVLVPLKFVAEGLGMKVGFDAESNTIDLVDASE